MSTEDAGPCGSEFSGGLGPLPEDALRRQAFLVLSRLQSGTEDVVRLDVALAAVAAERERCAMVCETLPCRGSEYDAATMDCAAAIRDGA